MEFPLAGGCLCRTIRYQISAEPRSADYLSLQHVSARGRGGGKAHRGE
jgi:hypothetical protein